MEGIELKVGKLSSQSAAIHETHNTFPFLRKMHYFTLPSFIVMLQRKVIWYIYFRDAKPKYFAVLLIFPSNQLKNEIFFFVMKLYYLF